MNAPARKRSELLDEEVSSMISKIASTLCPTAFVSCRFSLSISENDLDIARRRWHGWKDDTSQRLVHILDDLTNIPRSVQLFLLLDDSPLDSRFDLMSVLGRELEPLLAAIRTAPWIALVAHCRPCLGDAMVAIRLDWGLPSPEA